MVSDAFFQRGVLLYEQGRYADAEQQLRQAIGGDPQNASAYVILSHCLAHRQAWAEASAAANEAVGLSPDNPYAHYARATVAYRRDRYEEAEQAIRTSIQLDPYNPDFFWLLGAIRFDLRQWPSALEAAEQGLAIDAEHADCVNLRAMALVKLGRRDEAGAAIGAALERDPESALTHANQGWTLLHAGEHQRALEHFREALRIDASLEWARLGMVEALKARHLVYRVMLRYFLWMSSLSGGAQWAIILGGYFGHRLLSGLSRQNPAIRPYVLPVLIAYFAFAILTWLATPLFDLLLRLSRFGRLALSRSQTIASNLTGGLLLATAVALVAWLARGDERLLMLAAVCGLLMLPVAAAFRVPDGWPTVAMIVACSLLAMLGLSAVIVLFVVPEVAADPRHPLAGAGVQTFNAFCYGVLIVSVGSNYLRGVRVQK